MNKLVISLDSLARISWNPFFPYMAQRVEQWVTP